MPEIDFIEWRTFVLSFTHCCLKKEHADIVNRAIRIEAWKKCCPGVSDGFALFELADGQWAYMVELAHKEGHGRTPPRCLSTIAVCKTRAEAICALDGYGRKALGISEDETCRC